jgi:VanZ family protein
MKRVAYILFIVIYVVVLTFLLLHPKLSKHTSDRIAVETAIERATLATILTAEAHAPHCVALLHFIVFLPLAFCVSQVCGKRTVWIGLLALILYAIATELLQEYIPPRAFRWEDLTQDIAGIIVGLFFGYYLKFIRQELDTNEITAVNNGRLTMYE